MKEDKFDTKDSEKDKDGGERHTKAHKGGT
jgi:hypothetical protein